MEWTPELEVQLHSTTSLGAHVTEEMIAWHQFARDAEAVRPSKELAWTQYPRLTTSA